MEIIELILDENEELTGIEAVSIVENPAIESDFIALASDEVQLAKLDEEKKLLMGAALIPNKPIYRKRNDTDFYVYFSKDTVRKASEMFFQNGNQNNATLEHDMEVKGLTVVESWIVEDNQMDKSTMYGLNVPNGTWMISMKVNNEEVWQEYVKENKVKGFSIEGYFADRAKISRDSVKDEMTAIENKEAEYILSQVKNVLSNEKITLESYNDYPDAVSNNAKRGRELNEKVNNKCATDIGKIRSADLEAKRNLSVETIKRMYSYLSRAGEYYDEGNNEACGTISYLLWGGKAGLRWSESKLKKLGEIDLSSMVVDDNFAIIDDRLAYSTQQKAEEMAKNLGCEGFHVHKYQDKDWFMPCEKHEMKKPCQASYQQKGYKIINGKKKPNCVKIKYEKENK